MNLLRRLLLAVRITVLEACIGLTRADFYHVVDKLGRQRQKLALLKQAHDTLDGRHRPSIHQLRSR